MDNILKEFLLRVRYAIYTKAENLQMTVNGQPLVLRPEKFVGGKVYGYWISPYLFLQQNPNKGSFWASRVNRDGLHVIWIIKKNHPDDRFGNYVGQIINNTLLMKRNGKMEPIGTF
jgi:hypothetical protein